MLWCKCKCYVIYYVSKTALILDFLVYYFAWNASEAEDSLTAQLQPIPLLHYSPVKNLHILPPLEWGYPF